MSTPKIVYKQYGGKASIARWIVGHFPEHRVYLEPFCGSCAVLFAKPRSFIEVVNDLDGRLTRMFETLRSRPQELAALLWATPYAQADWREVTVGTDALEEARLSMAESVQFYCGNRNTSTWSLEKSGAPRKPKNEVWADWFLRVLPAAARMKSVEILNEDALRCISRLHMQEDVLIYADPPYVGHGREYEHQVDYGELARILGDARAKVVVSGYPECGDYWPGWRVVVKETTGRARTGAHNVKAKKKIEVLYCNW